MEQTKTNPWMVSTLILAGLVVGFGVAQIPGLSVKGQTPVPVAPSPAPQAAAPEEDPPPVLTQEQIKNLPEDDASFGSDNAPITIVEFSDYQCPYCAKFFALTLAQIEDNYIKTGKARLVYRDFPLDFHPQAQKAAEAAECAGDQNKYREMHDELFATQTLWSANPAANDVFKQHAKKIGLNQKKFDSCLDDGTQANEVRKDLIEGASVGVSGTPGFFINGKLISGAMPYEEVFKPALDAELAGKDWELKYDAQRQPYIEVK